MRLRLVSTIVRELFFFSMDVFKPLFCFRFLQFGFDDAHNDACPQQNLSRDMTNPAFLEMHKQRRRSAAC